MCQQYETLKLLELELSSRKITNIVIRQADYQWLVGSISSDDCMLSNIYSRCYVWLMVELATDSQDHPFRMITLNWSHTEITCRYRQLSRVGDKRCQAINRKSHVVTRDWRLNDDREQGKISSLLFILIVRLLDQLDGVTYKSNDDTD